MKPEDLGSLKQFDLYKLLGPLVKEYLKCKPIGSIIIMIQSKVIIFVCFIYMELKLIFELVKGS
jgi:hypothetical protein